jgi:uncharacterized protein YdaU (DUF1376 family)
VAKAPAFQFYPKDYETDEHVKLMTLEQEGAYLRLMCHQWLHESIPDDVSQLALICRTSAAKMRKLWPGIAPCFPVSEIGRRANRRMSNDNEELKRFRENRALAGAAGGKAKAAKQTPSTAKPEPVAKASPPFSVLQPATANGNGLPDASASEPDWNRAAADVFKRQFPKGSVPGAMFRVCKPLVLAHGWAEVSRELDAYLERVPVDFHNWPKFASGFGRWTQAPKVRGQLATADNARVLDEFVSKVVEAIG